MSPKVMASFSAFGGDLPSIAFIVLHSLEGSVLWSSVSTNCLHVFLRCSFVVLVISSFICCRAGEVGSLDLRSSRALIFSNISAGTGSVLIRCRPEGICRDAAFRMMVRKIFSPFWQFGGSRLLLSLSSISLLYRSQFAFFKLKLVRWGMGLIVVVVDLPLLRVAVEGSDNPVSLEKPCQASLPPDQQGRHSLGRQPEVQYVA